MHFAPDAVPAVTVDDAEAAAKGLLRLVGSGLDGMRDIGEARAVDHCRDARLHRQSCRVREVLVGLREFADPEGPCGVAVPAVENGAAVDRDEISLGEHNGRRRDSVHHNVVDGAADRAGEPVVALERRDRSRAADHRLGHLVELEGAHPGLSGVANRDERLPHNGSRRSHGVELARAAERNTFGLTEPHRRSIPKRP